MALNITFRQFRQRSTLENTLNLLRAEIEAPHKYLMRWRMGVAPTGYRHASPDNTV